MSSKSVEVFADEVSAMLETFVWLDEDVEGSSHALAIGKTNNTTKAKKTAPHPARQLIFGLLFLGGMGALG